jgi:hypothetical protein
MAEWLNALVLKTSRCKSLGGSNPSSSALESPSCIGARYWFAKPGAVKGLGVQFPHSPLYIPRMDKTCSFCKKDQKAVKKLIAGPEVYICNECVGLCNDIMSEEIGGVNLDTTVFKDESKAAYVEVEKAFGLPALPLGQRFWDEAIKWYHKKLAEKKKG